jgi:hypothetical protein
MGVADKSRFGVSWQTTRRDGRRGKGGLFHTQRRRAAAAAGGSKGKEEEELRAGTDLGVF